MGEAQAPLHGCDSHGIAAPVGVVPRFAPKLDGGLEFAQSLTGPSEIFHEAESLDRGTVRTALVLRSPLLEPVECGAQVVGSLLSSEALQRTASRCCEVWNGLVSVSFGVPVGEVEGELLSVIEGSFSV